MGQWQSKEDLKQLLITLLEHGSVTGSRGEVGFSEYLKQQFNKLPYFKQHPDAVGLHRMKDGRSLVTALVRKPSGKKTVILLSHFDVVGTDDYGKWRNLAFQPLALTHNFYRHQEKLPAAVREDLKEGDWLFGRGAMDMKAGLALQMSMIEQACTGNFDGNLLLLSVPDEEVHSAGMIEAVRVLNHLAAKHKLEYTVCLNSEPMFSEYPGDRHHYIYSGSVGKVLPGFFCYGKETHVGEPFAGLNANLMASKITQKLELNADFCEQAGGEVTPPPTNLRQKDFKEAYSVQTPHTAVTNFNLLTMGKSFEKINDQLLEMARETAEEIKNHYLQAKKQIRKWQAFTPMDFKVRVYTYEILWKTAAQKFGKEEIERRQNAILANPDDLDNQDLTAALISDLVSLCKEDAPMIVLFYHPPFYPAVSSMDHPLIQSVIQRVSRYSETNDNISLTQRRYFPGLSDLSFTSLYQSEDSLHPLIVNMPLYGQGYELPLEAIRALDVPVMNLGPLGRDAHQWTERLELDYSFVKLHDMLSYTIQELLTATLLI